MKYSCGVTATRLLELSDLSCSPECGLRVQTWKGVVNHPWEKPRVSEHVQASKSSESDFHQCKSFLQAYLKELNHCGGYKSVLQLEHILNFFFSSTGDRYFYVNDVYTQVEFKSHQWFGATVRSHGNNTLVRCHSFVDVQCRCCALWVFHCLNCKVELF